MNHIYKTVWNATLGTWTAVQETAKSHGKTSSGKAARIASQGSLVLRFAFTLVASAALLVSGRAIADAFGNQHPVPAGNGNHYCYYDATSQSVICGDDATKTVNPISGKTAKAIVIGKGALNTGESSMAIGLDSSSAGTASLAVGNSAKAGADQAVAVGQHAQANGKWDVSIGRQAGWNAKAPNSAAPTGNEGRNIAIGDAALKNGLNVNNNMAMGTSAGENLTGTHNVIIGTYANADEAIQSAMAAGSNQTQINFKEREVDVLGSTSKRKVKYIDTSSTVAIGHRALATSAGGVAVGQQAKAFGATTVAIGNSSRALGNNAVAMGNTANAGATAAIAIGHQVNYQPEVKNGPTVVTPAAYKQAGANSIAIGTHSHSSALRSIAIGTEAKATGEHSTALGNEAAAKHVWSVAIGHQAETRGKYALAIGAKAKAGSLSVADGNSWGMAIGYNAEAGGWGSPIAIGTESKTLGESPVAIGDFATAEGDGAVAIGGKRSGKHLPRRSTYAKGVQTTALGYLAQATEQDALALGANANALHQSSVALGSGSFTTDVDNTGRNSATVGGITYSGFAEDAPTSMVSVGRVQTTIPDPENPSAQNIVLLPISRTITNVAAGRISATSTDAINGSQLHATQTVIGNLASSTARNFGGGAAVQADGSISAPTYSINGSNYNDVGSALQAAAASGGGTHYYSVNSTETGAGSNYNNDGATGSNALAAGVAASATEESALAVGHKAQATEKFTVAVGLDAKATVLGAMAAGNGATAAGQDAVALGKASQATANFATAVGNAANAGLEAAAVGNGAVASGEYATAFGTGSKALANGAAALGNDAKAGGWAAVAVGRDAQASNTVSVAIGEGARAAHEHSVALGSGSATALVDNTGRASATVGGITYSGFAADAPTSMVSVGREGITITPPAGAPIVVPAINRTITNVAAGRISATSTDAINGSQLHATQTVIGNVADTTAAHLGGGAAVGADGKISAPTYNVTNAAGNTVGTAASNVGAALANLNNYVNSGFDVQGNGTTQGTVSPTEKINFVNGAGTTAVVSSEANGITNITFDVNAQGLAESAQLPVVYTRADGAKVYKHSDGKFYDKPEGQTGAVEVPTANVIASMQNPDGSTTTATTLANVKAGVNATDAVNVSQLQGAAAALGGGAGVNADGTFKAPSYTIRKTDGTSYAAVDDVGAALGNLNAEVIKPLTFAGDSGTASTRKLGSTLNVKGGATGTLTDGNIGVVADATTNTLNIKLAQNIDLGAAGSVQTGNTTVNNDGISIAAANPVSLTAQGLNNGGNKISNVADGAAPNDAVNFSQLQAVAAAADAAKTHFYSVRSTDPAAGNYNNDGATGIDALAAGVGASAKQNYSVAVGTGAKTIGDPTSGSESIAIGRNASAAGDASLAIGPRATVTSDAGTSPNGIAIGTAATAKNGGMAVGSGADSGNGTELSPGTSIRLNNNVALGDSARVKDDTNFRVALGTMSIAGEADLNAAPYTPTAGATLAGIAASGVTLGEVSVGGDNTNYPGDILYRRITNVAAGAADTDAVNVSQLKAVAKASATHYYSVNSTEQGAGSNYNNDGATGSNALAAGRKAKAAGANSVAVGNEASAGHNLSVAIGHAAQTRGKHALAIGARAKAGTEGSPAGADAGSWGTAIGYNAEAAGLASPLAIGTESMTVGGQSPIAIGDWATADGTGAIAIGSKAGGKHLPRRSTYAKGVQTTALGYLAQATEQDALALGANANALHQSSVALGSGSFTTDVDNTGRASATVGGITYSGFAADAPTSMVSVGRVQTTIPDPENSSAPNIVLLPISRTITNVAAGRIAADSTDAINGSQLHATQTVIGNVAGSVKNILGGDAAVGGDGKLSMSNIGGTGKGTIHEAIAAATTKVTSNNSSIGVTHDATTNTYDLSVNAQGLAESAQLPVVYTKANGDKVYKHSDGNFYDKPEGDPAAQQLDPANIIASMQNANGSTTAPTTLANVKAGVNATDAVNVSQLQGAAAALGGGAGVNPATGAFTAPSYVINKTDGTSYAAVNDVGAALGNLNAEVVKPLTITGNTNSDTGSDGSQQTLGSTLAISGGLADASKTSSNSNIRTVITDNKVDIQLADAPTFTGTVTAPIFVAHGAQNRITIDGNTGNISGLSRNLPKTQSENTAGPGNPSNITTAQALPAGVDALASNAATVGDVLNAGWNLQGNSTAKDFVRAYDTVNFVNGNGTTVEVDSDGATSTIKVNVNAQGLAESAQLPVVYTKADGSKVYKHSDGKFYDKPEGQTGAVEVPTANVIASMQNANGSTTAPTTLANVKAGVNDNDAVNMAQLKAVEAAADAAKTHFYSVNNTDASAGNYNNDGATGADALAAGVDATATGMSATAVGHKAKAGADFAVAVGFDAQATASGAMALGNGAQAAGQDSLAHGKASKATGDFATAVGNAASAGLHATAVGNGAVASGEYATAFGTGSKALANGAAALGNSAKAEGWAAVAMGHGAQALQTGAVAIGEGARAAHEHSVALGRDSATAEVDNTGRASATVGGITYSGFAANTPTSMVSVGTQGAERTITNVAAGRISATSTDAINGSQLHATQTVIGNVAGSVKDILGGGAAVQADGKLSMGNNIGGTGQNTIDAAIASIKNIADQSAQPLTFAGDSGAGVARTLGTTLNVKGGATGDLTANNIGVEGDAATGTLNIKLAKDVDLGETGSVKTGSTTVNNGGVTIANLDPKKVVSLTNAGLNNGGNQVINVASGGDVGTNAANIDDVKRLAKLADTSASVSAGSSAVTVTPSAPVNGVTSYAVDLSDATKASLAKANNSVQDIKSIDPNLLVSKNGKNITLDFKDDPKFGKTTVGNVVTDGATNKITGLNNGVLNSASKDAVNGSQLYAVGNSTAAALGGTSAFDPATGAVTAGLNVGGTTHTSVQDALNAINTTAGAGWNLQANGGAASNVAPNGTVNVIDGKNTTVTLTGNTLKVDVVDAPTFTGKVTAGGGLDVAGSGLTVGGSLTVAPNTNVDMGNNIIHNVADGVADTDAANMGQLRAMSGNITNITNQINAVDTRVTNVDNRVTHLSGRVDGIDARVTNVDNRVTQVDSRVTDLTGRVDGIDTRVTDVTNLVGPNLTNPDGTKGLEVYDVSKQTLTEHQTVIEALNQVKREGTKYSHTQDNGEAPIIGPSNASSAGAPASTATGLNAIVDKEAVSGLAAGHRARVRSRGRKAIAAGHEAIADGESAVAIGDGAQALAEKTIAIGTKNVVRAARSGAIGDPTTIIATATDSYSIGNNNTVNTADTFVMGNNVVTSVANSVYLGAGAAATAAPTAQTAGMASYNAQVVDGVTHHYAGGTPVGVVSVGDVGQERRVQNVAAGLVSPTSTDAINGSQLYQTNAAIGNLNNRININHDKAMGGIASAMASAGLPQAYLPGKSMIAMGVGAYQGRSAVAVGVSTISDNGRWIIKGSVNANNKGNVGATLGAGYQW